MLLLSLLAATNEKQLTSMDTPASDVSLREVAGLKMAVSMGEEEEKEEGNE